MILPGLVFRIPGFPGPEPLKGFLEELRHCLKGCAVTLPEPFIARFCFQFCQFLLACGFIHSYVMLTIFLCPHRQKEIPDKTGAAEETGEQDLLLFCRIYTILVCFQDHTDIIAPNICLRKRN